jgi:exodeoxyribonuclease VII large subunit
MLRHPVLQRPKARLNQQKQFIDMLQGRLIRSFRTVVGAKNQQFMKLAEKLAVLNPHAILSRGYCIARLYPDKTLVRTVRSITKNQEIEVLLADGSLLCKVDSILGEEKNNVGQDGQ